MATLNKVITAQELHTREIDHNLTLLLGIASGQEYDIKAIQSDVSRMQADLSTIKEHLAQLGSHLDERFDAMMALLTSRPSEQ